RLWQVTTRPSALFTDQAAEGSSSGPERVPKSAGTHRPGWEGIALWSYVRSINAAKEAKSSERAPLIVTPILKPTVMWTGPFV
ncbi:MAG TPA: hypothetical protein VK499_05135, partial [Propionibacteriaceae bacterium]|nr:hypothetical protein [Propionibacteriaceae bacterium]